MVSVELRKLIVANAEAGIRVEEMRPILQVGKSTLKYAKEKPGFPRA